MSKSTELPIAASDKNAFVEKSRGQFFLAIFKKNKIAGISFFVFLFFFLCAVYAPFLASSKPIFVIWGNEIYFPLFRYLFYSGFYTKPIDLFFNVLMFTLPLGIAIFFFVKKPLKKGLILGLICVHFLLFGLFVSGIIKNPEREVKKEVSITTEKQNGYHHDPLLAPLAPKKNWEMELNALASYQKFNLVLRHKQRKQQHERLYVYAKAYEESQKRPIPTLWAVDEKNDAQKQVALQKVVDETRAAYTKAKNQLPDLMEGYKPFSHALIMAKYELEHAAPGDIARAEKKYNGILKESQHVRLPLMEARNTIDLYEQSLSELNYLKEKKDWLEKENPRVKVVIPTLLRNFHWQDDAGGAQAFNKTLPWWELTRINRKDLAASLIFGIRVSLIVGISAVTLSLIIGIFLGTISGYFAGKTDLIICRAIEVWEAMPTFFMLLLIVAITQSKSLFLVVLVLGLFGWTAKCRFMRAEVLRQRNLPYVLAATNLGFPHRKIMFSDILPNAIPPILTLLPFSMMAAITSEAGLSFLGLGEEGSTSWGVLMDEGRSVFPAESYLLWPPAILLTILLISIALVGDALRDALDPKMR